MLLWPAALGEFSLPAALDGAAVADAVGVGVRLWFAVRDVCQMLFLDVAV